MQAIVDFHQYYKPIQDNAPAECIDLLEKHTASIDSLLSLGNSAVSSSLKSYFGLGGVSADADFVNALSLPLGSWQARNWDPAVGSDAFDSFCAQLVGEDDAGVGTMEAIYEEISEVLGDYVSLPQWPGRTFASFKSYAQFVKENIAAACPEEEEQDGCFGAGGEDEGQDKSMEGGMWKSWPW